MAVVGGIMEDISGDTGGDLACGTSLAGDS